VPDLNQSFFEEARAATRGVLSLIVGDRTASRYFSFTQQGLVGSFIAVLVVTSAELVVTVMMGLGGIFEAAVQTTILYAAVLGSSALFLRQIHRQDAWVPFVVTINWANAVLSVVLLATTLIGFTLLQLVILIAGIILSVNIARLIMTLRPLHIVLMIIAQAVGLFAALLVIIVLFPPSAADLAQLMAAASNRP